MSAAERALDRVRDVLDGRKLVWFGIRGEDGEALLQIPELEASYSIIARLRSSSLQEHANVSLEQLTGVREDLDAYDIDDDRGRTPAVVEFRRRLLREVSGRCVLITYRPSALVSALAFAESGSMTLAGLFKDRQMGFEHKPWVETNLKRRGVRGLGWAYIADEHRHRARRMLETGPQVVRANRSSGGVGIALVRTEDELTANWPPQADSFIGLAPYLSPGTPLNFSGCVFDDGSVRLHPPSVQIIGIASCTDRPFGYCGNDFGAIKELGGDVLDQLHHMGMTIGAWLHEERYRGVFGVDALVHDGVVHFTEVNARFQGSSALSARVAREREAPDLFLDHLAATLGLTPSDEGRTLGEWAEDQNAIAKVVLHNPTDGQLQRVSGHTFPGSGDGVRVDQMPPVTARIQPGATLCSLTVNRTATTDGFTLGPETEQLVSQARAGFRSANEEAAS